MLLFGLQAGSSSAERSAVCSKRAVKELGSARLVYGAGSVEIYDNTHGVLSLQKCALVLQCVENVRDAALVRVRPAGWVVCMGARVRGALVLSFAAAQGGPAWCGR